MTKEPSFPRYEINGPMTIFSSFQVSCMPPNFEDEDLSIDQPVNEVVDINQQVSIHKLKVQ